MQGAYWWRFPLVVRSHFEFELLVSCRLCVAELRVRLEDFLQGHKESWWRRRPGMACSFPVDLEAHASLGWYGNSPCTCRRTYCWLSSLCVLWVLIKLEGVFYFFNFFLRMPSKLITLIKTCRTFLCIIEANFKIVKMKIFRRWIAITSTTKSAPEWRIIFTEFAGELSVGDFESCPFSVEPESFLWSGEMGWLA